MRRVVVLFGLLILFGEIFSISLVYAQSPYVSRYSDLRGMEDKDQNTHLFYTLYEAYKNPKYPDDNSIVTIFNYDISKNIVTPFLYAGYSCDAYPFYCTGRSIQDFEFWNNDPSKYIFCGTSSGMDPSPLLERYDRPLLARGLGGVMNVEISKQNDSLLFYSTNSYLFKSTDGGDNWSITSNNFRLLSLSPFNDSLIFGLSNRGYLLRSSDGGKTTDIADSVHNDGYSSYYNLLNFFFDKDSSHIYWTVRNCLYVSPCSGKPGSFVKVFTGKANLKESVDTKRSGRIYLADGSDILFSEDFGCSFKPFGSLDKDIIGIYAKPGKDIVYAATRNGIFEVTPSSVKTLKILYAPEGLTSYYPLAIGNKWIYSFKDSTANQPAFNSTMIREVSGDTTMQNGKKYFVIRETGPYPAKTYTMFYERIDSIEAKIFRYISDKSGEYLVDDLFADMGDTVLSYRFNYSGPLKTVLKNDDMIKYWDASYARKHFESDSLVSWKYDLLQGIGVSHIENIKVSGSAIYTLEGCSVGGTTYGNIHYVGVDEKISRADKFELFQNYPNPFNPATVIKYNIPAACFVSLKVYDPLGKEVASLVDEEQSQGMHEVTFPKTGSEVSLSSGIYFYTIKAAGQSQTHKMLYLK
ncbi:MAG: T9SS type A sorting domain-containing protein [Bacteroidota bacterium]|nr:T9SS type A sorting domain-containing protein [Bacteroidota bacterium]MDP4195872.1 T9SS type A sorting domain-containing protein [Bacteroidota bacterium]